MQAIDFSKQSVQPILEGVEALSDIEVLALLEHLHDRWTYVTHGNRIAGVYKFKNYKQALMFVNAISVEAEDVQHHPDIRFGWGYVEVEMMTHSIAGLHTNDFILAAKFDKIYDDLMTVNDKEKADQVAHEIKEDVPVIQNDILENE